MPQNKVQVPPTLRRIEKELPAYICFFLTHLYFSISILAQQAQSQEILGHSAGQNSFYILTQNLLQSRLTAAQAFTKQHRYLKLNKDSPSNKVRCVNTVPSSSTETLRIMTGLEYAGIIKGKLDGTA